MPITINLSIPIAVFVLVTSQTLDTALAAGAGSASDYVGSQQCASCHESQHRSWSGSHHDLAMQPATAQTVLGDFDDARFTYFGLTSTFFKRDGTFMVRTDGPDGALRDYEIKYTFGVDPLQQYLIEFPDGRLQALGIAWDSRPADAGGQRWFHLYPDEKIAPGDNLHWTGPDQNWNYMCAECHSTNLQKHYDPETNRYATDWSEIDVACEACHGPGARHISWTRHEPGWEQLAADKGLALLLDEREGVTWAMDPDNATRSRPRQSSREIETCARCHSRRGMFREDYVHGRRLLDTHLPSLLSEQLYHADGQIQDEVYVYGSFLQSKMHQAGVTCSDCHEPHSLQLRAPGDGVCLQCHLQEKYAVPSHHFHLGSAGARCVECHMPETAYMVVDPRRDHSMRIPRPDLSLTLGVPNACNRCHTDRGPEWAAAQFEQWYGKPDEPHYGSALHAGHTGAPTAERLLTELALDRSAPGIVRASALELLPAYLSRDSFEAVQRGLQDNDPLLRVAALGVLDVLPAQHRPTLAWPLLRDPVRAVRIEAARVLAGTPPESLTGEQTALLDGAIEEYIAAQQSNAERPESYLNIGLLHTQRGALEKAEAAYRTALERQASFLPAYINLADLYRMQGKDDAGEELLRQALALAPDDAAAHHTLGLLLVRQKRLPEAVEALARAAAEQPGNARYGYVYAVALNNTGDPAGAIAALEKAHQNHPNDRDILYALVTFNRDAGKTNAARHYAGKLVELAPNDPGVRRLLQQLR